MLDDRRFWYGLMAALLAIYAAGAVVALAGHPTHALVRLSLILLAAHVLELPLAFRALRGRPLQRARVVLATLVFGGVWWIPARRGVFATGA